jgi:hypothetical protein
MPLSLLSLFVTATAAGIQATISRNNSTANLFVEFRNHDTKFRRQSGHVFVRMQQIHQCRRDGTQKAIGRIDGTSNHSEGLFGTRRLRAKTRRSGIW